MRISDWSSDVCSSDLVARRPIRTLSKGMAQTVQLLGTFIHQPKLIVLDEPFSGLDPLNQQGLEELIRAERQRGATILFSTHVMAHAERLCESLTIIGDGKVRSEEHTSELQSLMRKSYAVFCLKKNK